MCLKQIVISTCILTSALLVRADYSYGSGGGSGSGSGYGSGSGSGGGHGNQGDQSTAYYGSGYGGGGGGGYNTATALIQTVSVIETEIMMMTSTVTESACSTNAVAPYSATTSTSPPSWGPPSTVEVQVVHVSDNNGTLAYWPEMVVAAPGTLVEFIFYPKNHTVTQSSFAAPCVPIGISTPNITTAGIKSGFVPVAANATDFMNGIRSSFTVMVKDTKPIWIYCGQLGHCEKGMSMVINQNMSDTVHTLANYRIAAAQIPIPDANSTTAAPAAPSTSTSTVTAPPPPPAATSSTSVVTQQPVAPTTSSTPVESPTSAVSIAPFTGAAVVLTAKDMAAAAGVLAMGIAALL